MRQRFYDALVYVDDDMVSQTAVAFLPQGMVAISSQWEVVAEFVSTLFVCEEMPVGLAGSCGLSTVILMRLCWPHAAFRLGRSIVRV